jgi:hypothetical protein
MSNGSILLMLSCPRHLYCVSHTNTAYVDAHILYYTETCYFLLLKCFVQSYSAQHITMDHWFNRVRNMVEISINYFYLSSHGCKTDRQGFTVGEFRVGEFTVGEFRVCEFWVR